MKRTKATFPFKGESPIKGRYSSKTRDYSKKTTTDKKRDYSKKADYSKEATKDNFGSKLADAITPDISKDNTTMENIKEVVKTVVPVHKAIKLAKIGYDMVKGDKT
tara:strand:+ start:1045 stop:1362 length:318 start_codon:yes stop_codon:yes gene_type:complete